MAAARAALKGETRQSSPMSAMTPQSVTSVMERNQLEECHR